MKKILGVLIVGLTLISSTFALGLSVIPKGFMGGRLGDIQSATADKDVSALAGGGGLAVNLELFGGLGAQAEANFVFNKSGINYLDLPVMGWWELNLFDFLKIGLGAGVNFSNVFLGKDSKAIADAVKSIDGISSWKTGMAAGLNTKICFGKHFGIVVGVNGVFEFSPNEYLQASVQQAVLNAQTGSNDKVSPLSQLNDDSKRNEIYGYAGIEWRFF